MSIETRKGIQFSREGISMPEWWFRIFVGLNIVIVAVLAWLMIAFPTYGVYMLKSFAWLAAFLAGRFVATKVWHAFRARKERPDVDGADRVEPDRVGAVQVLDPRVELEPRGASEAVRRNGMGVPVYTPAAESSYDRGGLIGGPVTVLNDTGRPIRIYTREQLVTFRRLIRAARIASAPTKDDPYFRRQTPQFKEARRILGPRSRLVLAISVRQINGRYLKADQLVIDESGFPVRDGAGGVKTKSVRIRIPRDSWLRKDFKHPKR